MFQSNLKFYVKSTISSTQGVGTTFTVSTDFELGQAIETSGQSVSIKLTSGTQVERMEVTMTGGVATIVKRGITQSGTEATDTNLQKQWTDGTIGVITALAFDLVDKQGDTMTGSLKFSGSTNQGIVPNSLTTAQRTALTPTNGAIVYDSDLGELYQYISGAWSAVSSGSTQPNMSTTVAGKGQSSTQAHFDAGTDAGVTGSQNVALNSQIQKQISTSTAKTTMVLADSFGISDSADSGKIKRLTLAQLLGTADAQATDTTSGVVERLTDIEATTGTDTVRYLTAKQAKDNYGRSFYITQFLKDHSEGSVTQTITHSLGKTPKKITIEAIEYDGSAIGKSSGVYTTGNHCAYRLSGSGIGDISTTFSVIVGSTATVNNAGVVGNLTTSTFDIVWTKSNSPTGNSSIIVTVEA